MSILARKSTHLGFESKHRQLTPKGLVDTFILHTERPDMGETPQTPVYSGFARQIFYGKNLKVKRICEGEMVKGEF
jgi:hypothetical protein